MPVNATVLEKYAGNTDFATHKKFFLIKIFWKTRVPSGTSGLFEDDGASCRTVRDDVEETVTYTYGVQWDNSEAMSLAAESNHTCMFRLEWFSLGVNGRLEAYAWANETGKTLEKELCCPESCGFALSVFNPEAGIDDNLAFSTE